MKVNGTTKRPGIMIAFLGLDGSGKSTIINMIETDLRSEFAHTKRYHFRPYWGKSIEGGKANSTPHAQIPRTGISSLAKILLWSIDYKLSYTKNILPQLRDSTLVLFDRYYHDILVDPLRYRYGGPTWLINRISYLIPRPHLFILLDAPAEVIRKRKQEVEEGEIMRYRAAYLNLLNTLPNGYVVDATHPIDEVAQAVKQIIYSANQIKFNNNL